uniref:Uncharacterized protein n=1 Tax=Panagrolaimus davidi TaxID=227884 RepID=A0A914PJK7_9BILA
MGNLYGKIIPLIFDSDKNNADLPFPTDILKWMKKNANPRTSLKLMKICKYFQHKKFPFTVIKNYNSYDNSGTFYNLNKRTYDVAKFLGHPKNLWLSGTFHYNLDQRSYFSQLIEKCVACDIKCINLTHQIMTFDEYKMLTSGGNVENLWFTQTIVKSVSLEDIMKYLPNVVTIYM